MSGPFGASPWGYNPSTGFYDHTIDQSLRLDSTSGSYLTISSASPTATNRKKVTISCWVKRAGISVSGVNTVFWSTVNGLMLQFFTADNIYIYDNNAGGWQSTVTNGGRLFRDPSAWYHLALIIDTTQSTSADRAKFYINGELQTLNSYPGLNTDITWHTGSTIRLGSVGDTQDLAGYLAEFISIDGQDTSISDFGETKNGVWVPKDVSGLTLGNAGFHLDFANSADIGNDIGANNIDFTATNLSAHDVVPDSPTNNFGTMNPLDKNSMTVSEGNLKVVPSGDYKAIRGTFGIPTSGKWYFEARYLTPGGGNVQDNQVGIVTASNVLTGSSPYPQAFTYGVGYLGLGQINRGGSAAQSSLTAVTAGKILGVAVNVDDDEVQFYLDGSAVGTAEQLVSTTEPNFAFYVGATNRGVVFNFGQDSTFAGATTAGGNADANGIGDFAYAPPSGFLALCASNLPEPAIGSNIDANSTGTRSDEHFNTVLYTGNATARSITGVGFQADLLWFKNRPNTQHNNLIDSVRGSDKLLYSNLTNSEATTSIHLTSFDSDGFSIGTATSLNGNNNGIVTWCWKGGGNANTFNIDGTGYSTASDASLSGGDITPSGASINTKAGFGIIAYTGIGGSNASGYTIKHGLSSPPELIFIKDRDTNSNNNQWQASSSVVGDDYAYLSTTAQFTGAALMKPNSGDNTLLNIGIAGTAGARNTTNESGDDFIMYCFHSVDGFCKVGTYTGNATAYPSGVFVFTGFRPALVVVKATGTTSHWVVTDNKRASDYNGDTARQYWSNNVAETAYNSARNVELFSNGFMVHGASASDLSNKINQSTGYVYLAYAEAPFKYANAR